MDQFTQLLSEHFVISIMAGCFLVVIGMRTLSRIAATTGRERSRREIAAYIAEGTISADQGERLMRVGVNQGPSVP